MTMKVSKVKVWAADIADEPGGLATKLEALAEAGVNLEFAIARRRPEKPGRGVVFATPIKGAKQLAAAKKAGFRVANALHSVRVEGKDAPGVGAKGARALAEAGINLRGVSAAALGSKFIFYLAFDTEADASKAARILKKG